MAEGPSRATLEERPFPSTATPYYFAEFAHGGQFNIAFLRYCQRRSGPVIGLTFSGSVRPFRRRCKTTPAFLPVRSNGRDKEAIAPNTMRQDCLGALKKPSVASRSSRIRPLEAEPPG